MLAAGLLLSHPTGAAGVIFGGGPQSLSSWFYVVTVIFTSVGTLYRTTVSVDKVFTVVEDNVAEVVDSVSTAVASNSVNVVHLLGAMVITVLLLGFYQCTKA